MLRKTLKLTAIIPIYNSAHTISETLEHLYSAISESGIEEYEVVIVNDGSTDDLLEVLGKNMYLNLKLINRENSGRLITRIVGLQAAKFESVLLIDSRVHLQRYSLVHLLNAYSKKDLTGNFVSGPTRYAPNLNLIGIFWESISRLAWWRFFLPQRTFQLSDQNFNHYPKGTTCLFGPRSILLDEMQAVAENQVLNDHDVNDDTLVLRRIAGRHNFYIDKDFDAIYFPRTSAVSFLKHAFHRGKMFVSGYLMNVSRGFVAISLAVIPVVVLLAAITILIAPLTLILILVTYVFSILFLGLFRNLPIRNILTLILWGIPFLITYCGGIFVGLKRRYINE
jgi:glycosyltransferase involved in cell wall biosynthesis